MIGRVVLALAFVSIVSASSAQEPACSFYKVNTSVLNVSKDAGGNSYIDVLEDGEIACVTRQQKVDGRDWGYITHKLAKPNGTTPVNGWSTLRYMKQLSSAEAAAVLGAGAAPAAATAAAPPAAVAPPRAAVAAPSVAAAPATAPTVAPAKIRPEDVLHFDQPVPFGPFPVSGRSLKQLAESIPLFPPIEGLEEALWKKNCASCHKWTQTRLCEQGGAYVKTARYVLRHQHPFGGAYKVALMKWAKSGCN